MEGPMERMRGWLFLNVPDPHKAASAVAPYFSQGGNEWVIIRADVVEGHHNLIIPVDAVDDRWFEHVIKLVSEATGAGPSVARVVKHYPEPAHNAHSFVTRLELERKFAPEFDPPGRHMPKSPGANPWG